MKYYWSTFRWLTSKMKGFILSLIAISALDSLSSLLSIGMAIVSKNLIDSATSNQFDNAISSSFIFVAIIIFNMLINGFTSIKATEIHEKISNKMRSELFLRLSKLQWLDLSKYHSEDILTRMTSDIGTIVSLITDTIPGVLSLIILIAGSMISIMAFDSTLGIMTFLLGPLALLLSRLFSDKLKTLHIKIQESESSCRSFMQECIYNMTIIKAFCVEKQATNNINKLQKNKLSWTLRRSRLSIFSNTFLTLSFEAGYLLAFFWGAFRLSQNIITFGTFSAFLQLVGKVQGPFLSLAYALPQIIAAAASSGRLRELEALNYENSDVFIPRIKSAGIKLENVTFRYERDKVVLNNLSLDIKPGEIIGIIGRSGEGKTTLIRLLLSLIKPDLGNAYITTMDREKYEINTSSRHLISYIPQGNTLFSGTITDNLRIGSPDANDNELELAARAACAWEFINSLEDGLNTFVGEGGYGLSEGQLQRITIARAILKKSPILILDEATSALDTDTELHVLTSIKNLSPKRTCIIVTHRDKSLEICDKVFKLDGGCIIDCSNDSASCCSSQAV